MYDIIIVVHYFFASHYFVEVFKNFPLKLCRFDMREAGKHCVGERRFKMKTFVKLFGIKITI